VCVCVNKTWVLWSKMCVYVIDSDICVICVCIYIYIYAEGLIQNEKNEIFL
jgi:type IV secretory pathway TrbL component